MGRKVQIGGTTFMVNSFSREDAAETLETFSLITFDIHGMQNWNSATKNSK